MAETKSKKDAFRERYAKRFPGANMDDEEEYYGNANQIMDEYEGYESNSQKLRERMAASPAFAQMIVAAGQQENFDPVVWMVENKGLDLDALRDDPEYSKKLADAHNNYLEKLAQQDEIERQFAENAPESIASVKAKAREMGLTDEQAEQVVGQMYQIMDDLILGKINMDIFEQMAKGMKFDTAVADARNEGMAEGVSTRVSDKLRDLSSKKERTAGSQRAPREKKPVAVDNPFLAG